MHLAIDLLLNSQSILQQLGGFVRSALRYEHASENCQSGCSLRMIFSVPGPRYVQCLSIILLGFGIMPEVQLDCAEIDQGVRYQWVTIAIKLPLHHEYLFV